MDYVFFFSHRNRDVTHNQSCTILIKGPTDFVIAQIKDAIRDGLRAVKNVLDDKCVVKGAGCFEVACSTHLMGDVRRDTEGKAKLGVEAFAQALLGIPKILAENGGWVEEKFLRNLLDFFGKRND